MSSNTPSTPADYARLVIAQSIAEWKLAPPSPHEVARRAPRGYVPVRVKRRLRAAAVANGRPALAHSW